MLLRQTELEGILLGQVQLIYRCGPRPPAKTGGSLLTPIGKLTFVAVDDVQRSTITEDDARRAGYASLATLRAELDPYPQAHVFRITLGPLEPDPRVALRNQPVTASDSAEVATKLANLDRRAAAPWTRATLELIARRPETRATSLARELGQDREPFKLNVRKLKNLGLTESLDMGYRLSPRGESLLSWLQQRTRK